MKANYYYPEPLVKIEFAHRGLKLQPSAHIFHQSEETSRLMNLEESTRSL